MFGLIFGRRLSIDSPATFVSVAEFRRELSRERLRATRRSIPFCVVSIELLPASGSRRGDRFSRRTRRGDRVTVSSVLHRYTRLTDHKCEQSPGQFLWLLTDTPEMGGRSALARIVDLLHRRGVSVRSRLEVHDDVGFGHDEPQDNAAAAAGGRSSLANFVSDGGNNRGDDNDRRGGDAVPVRDDSNDIATNNIATNDLASNNANQTPVNSNPANLNSVDSNRSATMHRRGADMNGGGVALLDPPKVESTSSDASENVASPSWQIVDNQSWQRIDQMSPPGMPSIGMQPISSRSSFSYAIKRGIDIVGSIAGLTLLSPIIAAAAVAVRIQDGQPAIFKQTREGCGGRPFTIYKLRTMTVDAESKQADLRKLSHRDGPAFKIAADPRITPIGSFLRKTCIDELPQLINVLRGDMSLVGPRPLPWHESRACSRWHRRRLEIRPGMTCYWQINKASVKTFDQWMRLDLLYVRQGCFKEDIRLIIRTVAVPLFGRGGE